jgi:hypothetical protein
VRSRSTVGRELLWLGLFLVLLVIFEYVMLRFIVPLHFNDRIAVMIAAILAGVVWIVLRGWWMRRSGIA